MNKEIESAQIDISALSRAISRDDTDQAKFFLEHSTQPYKIDRWATSVAAENNNMEMVKLLTQYNAPITKRALRLATRNNNIQMVCYLLNQNENVLVGELAIEYAVKNSNRQILTLFLEFEKEIVSSSQQKVDLINKEIKSMDNKEIDDYSSARKLTHPLESKIIRKENIEMAELLKDNPVKKTLGNFVLVKKLPIEEISAGGIVYAKQTISAEQDRQCEATVIEFGPKAYCGYINGSECNGPDDWGVKVGDKVEFCRSYGQTPRCDDSEQYLIVLDKDLMITVA